LVSGDQVALGLGDGTFSLLPPLNYSVNLIADFNGDGKLDLLVFFNVGGGLHDVQQSGVALGNGDGTFGPVINVPQNGVLPQGTIVADMNGDGLPDIIFPAGNGIGVMLNNTSPGFSVSATALSPAPVTAGNSATSTITVAPTLGFNNTVTLSCGGVLVTGVTCSFKPASVTPTGNKAVTSVLTINTAAGTVVGNYSITLTGTSGTTSNSTAVSLAVQAAPDFAIAESPGSQTVGAGQTANFSLVVTPTGSFVGTVNLSCGITPAVTPAPTCTLSSSSLQIDGSGAQSAMVAVGTTAPVTTGMVPHDDFPPASIPLTWTVLLLGLGWLLLRNQRRQPILPMVLIAVVLATCAGCSSSSHSVTLLGTPSGTYTATVTANSGSLTHTATVQVVVR